MKLPITLALPSKGAIAEPTLNFLKECGLRVEKPNQRQYTGSLSTIPEVTVLFQRVTDILYKVADGTVEIGITGLDVVREHPHDNVVIIHDQLGFGHCSLVVAVPETWVDVETMDDLSDVALDFRQYQHRNIRIATKYTTLTRQYLHHHGVHHFTLVKAEGAIEAAPTLGYADIIIDVTQTGTTLRENHLKILRDGIILDSQVCLIGSRSALQENPMALHSIRILLEYIDGALNGRSYSQITANIQGKSAEDIAAKVAANPLTQGLQGPTIAPIYNSAIDSSKDSMWHTVSIVIANKNLLAAVEYLRAIGGTQTIVTPVRYVFLQESTTYKRLLQQLS